MKNAVSTALRTFGKTEDVKGSVNERNNYKTHNPEISNESGASAFDFQQSENSSERQDENSTRLKSLLRQERSENLVYWATKRAKFKFELGSHYLGNLFNRRYC